MRHRLVSLVLTCRPDLDPSFGADHPFSLSLVADAYFAKLPRTETNGIGKVQVELTSEAPSRDTLEDLGDVVVLSQPLDRARYAALDDAGKRRHLLDLLHQALLRVAATRGWDPAPFAEAHRGAAATGIVMAGWHGRTAKGSEGRTARLRYDYRQRIEVELVIRDHTGATYAELPIARLPAGFALMKATLGSVVWLGPQQLEVRHANGLDRWLVSLDDGAVAFLTARAARGDPHGLYDLGMLYVNEPQSFLYPDPGQARAWLERALAAGYERAKAALARLSPA